MAALDRFQGLFKRKPADEPDLSSVTDQDVAELAAARLAPSEDPGFGAVDLGSDDEQLLAAGGLVSVPLLGRRPAEQHQRTLAVLLAFGLVVLGAITFFVLSQTEKIGQQVATSGQALMQSQRLAKSVSQALVGSPSAFVEVQDSISVLTRSVRGLKQGDGEMALDALDTCAVSTFVVFLCAIDDFSCAVMQPLANPASNCVGYVFIFGSWYKLKLGGSGRSNGSTPGRRMGVWKNFWNKRLRLFVLDSSFSICMLSATGVFTQTYPRIWYSNILPCNLFFITCSR